MFGQLLNKTYQKELDIKKSGYGYVCIWEHEVKDKMNIIDNMWNISKLNEKFSEQENHNQELTNQAQINALRLAKLEQEIQEVKEAINAINEQVNILVRLAKIDLK